MPPDGTLKGDWYPTGDEGARYWRERANKGEAELSVVKPLIDRAAERERTLRRALTFVTNALGPNPGGCKTNRCEGCQVEMQDAYDAAKGALEEVGKDG